MLPDEPTRTWVAEEGIRERLVRELLTSSRQERYRDPVRALQMASEAVGLANECGSLPLRWEALVQQANLRYLTGECQAALEELLPLLEIEAPWFRPELRAETHVIVAGAYCSLGQYDTALENYLAGLRIAEERNEPRLLARVHAGLGMVYEMTGQQDLEEEAERTALAYARDGGDINQEIRILTNHSVTLCNRGRYKEALQCAHASLRLGQAQGDGMWPLWAAENVANALLGLERFEEAELCLRERLPEIERRGLPADVCGYLLLLGRILHRTERSDEALPLLERSLELAGETQHKAIEREAHQLLCDVLDALGDHRRALHHLRRASAIQGELFNQESDRRVRDLEVVHRTERARQEAEAERARSRELAREIAERRRMEEELRQARRVAETANLAKSQFLSFMTHELRTPMNGVLGMTSLLLDTVLDREQLDIVRTIRASGDVLLAIINDILDYSKIEAGKLQLELAPFDLRRCVEDSIELVTPKAAEKGIELACFLEPTVPRWVVQDDTRVRQVLTNLLSNAVKFTDQGHVVVRVGASRVDQGGSDGPASRVETRIASGGVRSETGATRTGATRAGASRAVAPRAGADRDAGPGHRVPEAPPSVPGGDGAAFEIRFSVEDTGTGIPADRLDALFESFTQADISTTRRFGGTGLGLAISRQLCELMGGRIWVESEVGTGSKFHFTVRARATREAFEPVTVHPVLQGKLAWIVEGSTIYREVIRVQLREWEMQTHVVGRLDRASLSELQASDASLLVLDAAAVEDWEEMNPTIRALGLPVVLVAPLGCNWRRSHRLPRSITIAKPIRPSALYDACISLLDDGSVVLPPRAGLRADVGLAERHPLRILLVEDNAVNQKVALGFLRRYGYQPDVAANGMEAIEAVARQAYDLVLMDINMPEMDGLEATRRILERWGEGAPRIVAMTANAMSGEPERYRAAGMADYVSKPFRPDEIITVLEGTRSVDRAA